MRMKLVAHDTQFFHNFNSTGLIYPFHWDEQTHYKRYSINSVFHLDNNLLYFSLRFNKFGNRVDLLKARNSNNSPI